VGVTCVDRPEEGPLASPQAAWIVDGTIESPREIFDPRASQRAKRCSADNLTFVHTMVLMDEEMVAADPMRIPVASTCLFKVRSLGRHMKMGRVSPALRSKVRKMRKVASPRGGQVPSPVVKVKARRVATPVRSKFGEDHLMHCRPEAAGLDAEVMKEIDEALHQKVKKGEIPGVISMVFRHGVLGHLDCYGFADLERKVEMRPDSIVRLYSMTKCVVSVALGVCLEEGLLDLNDHVSKYIPAFGNVKVSTEEGLVAASQPITVLHLLTHTSGIGYGPMLGEEPSCDGEERFKDLIVRTGLGRNSSDPNAVRTLEEWCNELAKIPLQHHPGTEWLYGYSHDVIGRIIEVVTGETLDVVIRNKVTVPLHMVDTGFEIPAAKWFRTSGMYRLEEEEGKDGKLLRIDAPSIESNEWITGNTSPILAGGGSVDAMTGGMVSTARDYSRFLLMLLRKGELDGIRVLKPETVELLSSNLLPRATGKDDVWTFGSPGVGFGLLGSVSVQHPELDEALKPGEYGWGGMAGTAWTNDPQEDFVLLSFSLVAFDLSTEEVLRAGVRKSIASFNHSRTCA